MKIFQNITIETFLFVVILKNYLLTPFSPFRVVNCYLAFSRAVVQSAFLAPIFFLKLR